MIPGQAAPMQQQAQQNAFQIPQIPANLFHPFQLQFHLQQRVPGQAAAMMVQPGQQPLQFMGPPQFAGFPFGIPPHLLQQQALQQQAQQQALQQQQVNFGFLIKSKKQDLYEFVYQFYLPLGTTAKSPATTNDNADGTSQWNNSQNRKWHSSKWTNPTGPKRDNSIIDLIIGQSTAATANGKSGESIKWE
jgi:hypothetical protein